MSTEKIKSRNELLSIAIRSLSKELENTNEVIKSIKLEHNYTYTVKTGKETYKIVAYDNKIEVIKS